MRMTKFVTLPLFIEVGQHMKIGLAILDFCCGSNDFSCLMSSKLEQMGKSCSFKNYDLFQAKNDFNFEKRDWMSVNAEELPNGNHLVRP
ncbi:hypothetical protein Lalb_Chr21g0317061 [Lupinus albus]|uniref:DM2 domain-containing protein n=1 Tax=Lupinus albus TaxID=3870 RepID=A0A6A4NHD1_LUPAL|nr:hypothetical protein Lalb_Chr21g0317061 [Lupinus albus]